MAGVSFAAVSHGQTLPRVNLGASSFVDVTPTVDAGVYYQNYAQYYHSDHFADSNGNTLSQSPELDVWIDISQFIYQSDVGSLLGGKWGVEALLPFVSPHIDPDGAPLKQADAGLGDLVFGPFVQWDAVTNAQGRPVFAHRLELACILPTGEYEADEDLNPGSNTLSINPYWAATYFATQRLALSSRIHYLWNDTNEDPSVTLFPTAETTQAGQAFHANFASSYALSPSLHLGINGYYLTQLTDAEVDGREIRGSREHVLAIGPGLLFSPAKDINLFVNSYFESDAENRPEGTLFQLRLTFSL